MVHSNEHGLPRTDVSGSEFEFGAPTSEEEAERKKGQAKRAPKSPLTAVLESWLLSILHCRFSFYQWLIPCLFPGDAETIPGVSGIEDISTGVETDGKLRGRHIVVTRSLVPLAGGPQPDVPEAVHSQGRSRELLERAFDDGNSCAQMRNLLVLFQVGSKCLPFFFLCRSVRDRSRCHCDSCHWSSDGVLVLLRLRGGESSVAVSLDEQLVFSALLGFSSFVF